MLSKQSRYFREKNKKDLKASSFLMNLISPIPYLRRFKKEDVKYIISEKEICAMLGEEIYILGIKIGKINISIFNIFRFGIYIEINRTSIHNNYVKSHFPKDKCGMSNQFRLYDELYGGARKNSISTPFISDLSFLDCFDIIPKISKRKDDPDIFNIKHVNKIDFFSQIAPDWCSEKSIKNFSPTKNPLFIEHVRFTLNNSVGFDIISHFDINLEELRDVALKGGFPNADVLPINKKILNSLVSFKQFLLANGFFYDDKNEELVGLYSHLNIVSKDRRFCDITHPFFNYFILLPSWYHMQRKDDQVVCFDLSPFWTPSQSNAYNRENKKLFYKKFGGIPLDVKCPKEMKLYEYFFLEKNIYCVESSYYEILEEEVNKILKEMGLNKKNARKIYRQHCHHFIIKENECSLLNIDKNLLFLCIPLTEDGHQGSMEKKGIVHPSMNYYQMIDSYFSHGIMNKCDLCLAIDFICYNLKNKKTKKAIINDIRSIKGYVEKLNDKDYARLDNFNFHRKLNYFEAFNCS